MTSPIETAEAPAPAAPGAAVPHAVFTTDDLAGGDPFAYWRDSISCIFEVEAQREVREEDFHAEVDAHMLGPVMLARTSSRRQHWARTPRLIARDGMDHYMVQLFEHGCTFWESRGSSFRIPDNGLVVFDLAREVDTVTDDFANLSLILPREMLQDSLERPDDQHMRVLQGTEPMVALLRDHMRSLKRLAARMSAQQAITVAPATAGLAAACLNAAACDRPDIRAGVALAQLGRIRRLIEAHLSEAELSADWIAGRVGVSRSKLYALFDEFGGVAAYVRDRRLRRALLMLTDASQGRRSIYDIALACGYGSDTAFSRAFRARYGVPPADARRRGAVPAPEDGDGEGLDRRYERWLRHLSV